MINLAPLKYSRVLTRHHGPLERLETGRIEVEGSVVYQANAYLSGTLNLPASQLQLFGRADGTGTHRSAMVARHMAISESIERWALYFLTGSGNLKPYGLDQDPTSNGIAAYPGLFDSQARDHALSEAAERFCLVGWWEGLLGFRWLEETLYGGGIAIDNPVSRHAVVLLWHRHEPGFHAYGFGAAPRLAEARWKALVERERAAAVLKAFYRDNPGFEADDLETVSHPFERRVLYFSLPEGYREFRLKLAAGRPAGGAPAAPQPRVDCRLDGPWNRFATVWRVLFPMPSKDYLSANSRVFFW